MSKFIKVEGEIICKDGRDTGYRVRQHKGGRTVVTNPLGREVKMPHSYYRIDTSFAVSGRPAWPEFVRDFLAVSG